MFEKLDFNPTQKIQRDLGIKDTQENTSEGVGKLSEQEKNIQEVFKLNPELEQAVREALGEDADYSNIVIELGRSKDSEPLGRVQNINVRYKGQLIIDSDNVQSNKLFLVTKKDGTSYVGDIYIPTDLQGQGLGIKILQKTANTLDTKIIPTYLSTGGHTLDNAKKMWEKVGNKITPKHDAEKLYAKYLETIFPESKVKDIVWHGTISSPFDTFDKDFEHNKKGVFFFGQFGQAKGYKDTDGGVLIPAVINLVNPYRQSDDEKWATDQLTKESFDEIKSFGNDGVTGLGIFNDPEYIAFKPEQVHILGSASDIEEFKQFASKKLNQKQ